MRPPPESPHANGCRWSCSRGAAHVPVCRACVPPSAHIYSTAAACDLLSYPPASKTPEVLRDDGIIQLDRLGGSPEDDAPGVDDDNVVGEIERQLDVLL